MADITAGRNGKPPYGVKVDPAHPLAWNLAYAVMFNEGMGDKVSNASWARSGTAEEFDNTAAWNTGVGQNLFGHHVDFEDGQVVDLGSGSATMINYSGDNFLSMAIMVHVDASNGTLIGKRDGNTAEFQLFDSGGTINWRVGSATQTLYSYTQNEWHLHSLSSYNNGTSRHFLDGQLVFNQTTTASRSAQPTINVSIGARWQNYPNDSFQLNGQVAFVYIWQNRYLSDEEHATLAADPYQMFEDRTEKRGFIFAEAAAGGRIMSSLVSAGGLAGPGGIAGEGGGLAG